tara:strand:- start:331 stop:513 length:183 start_codon:yes stop_codon:yes gene_type:complete
MDNTPAGQILKGAMESGSSNPNSTDKRQVLMSILDARKFTVRRYPDESSCLKLRPDQHDR